MIAPTLRVLALVALVTPAAALADAGVHPSLSAGLGAAQAGAGLFASAQAWFSVKDPDAYFTWPSQHQQVFTATVGWRWMFEPFFAEASLGLGAERILEGSIYSGVVDALLAAGVSF